MNKKIFKSVLILLLIVLAIYGIYKYTDTTNYVSKGKVKIIQEELFKGDAKKLEPQLNYFSVADIVLKYNTEKKGINIYYEEWKDGTIVKKHPLTELFDLNEITVTAKESEEHDL